MFSAGGFLLALIVGIFAARAHIYRWDNGQLIPGTEGTTPGPGAQLDYRQLEYARLENLNLTGARFDYSNLAIAEFVLANLANAYLYQ